MATIKSYTDKLKRKSCFKHNIIYCKKGDVIITYPNVLAAEAETGIPSDRIYKCCNGKKGFTGGFAWSYTPFEEYPDDGRIWKDVEGYENLYQVSTDGLVRTSHKGLWKILSAGKTKYGYYNVLLHKDGKRKNERVHRLIAKAFIPNPNDYPYINHKDEDKTNNHVENLEWCTAKYNVNYGTSQQRKISKQQIPILMFDINGNLLRTFNSIIDAETELKYNHECISRCCSGKIISYKNCIWLYKGQENLLQERIERCKNSNNFHRVARCDKTGNTLQIYPNISIAARESNTPRTQIDRQLKKNIISKNSKWLWKIV